MNSGVAHASRSLRPFLIGILFLVTSALVVAFSSRDALRFDDELRYHTLADSLLHKHEYVSPDGTATAWWPPGYPFAISAVYAVDDRPLSAKLLNVVFLGLAVCVAALLVRRLYPGGESIVPYIALGYPILLYTASTLYPQTMGSLLFLAIIFLVSSEKVSMPVAAVVGLLCGLLCLSIPAFMLTVPILLVYVVLAGSDSLRNALLRAALIGAVLVATMLPWVARNYAQFHALIPVSTNSGVNLLLGNSPLTQPNIKPEDISGLCPQARNPRDEVGYDHALTDCAVAWITQNPFPAARLYFGKVLNYFNYRNQLSTQSEMADWKNWVMFATYYPLLVMAIGRLAFIRRVRLSRIEGLLYALYFLNALTSAIFFTRVRFRIPFDFLLVVIDSAVVARLLDYWRQRRHAGSSFA